MKDKRFVPSNIARVMAPEDRKALGIRTPEENAEHTNLELEREVHNQFSSWLYRHGFEDFYHSDPTRRSRIRVGLPDFGVYRDSRIIFIEFKVKPNGLSPDQEAVFERMGANGNVIIICYSYEEATKAVLEFFK